MNVTLRDAYLMISTCKQEDLKQFYKLTPVNSKKTWSSSKSIDKNLAKLDETTLRLQSRHDFRGENVLSEVSLILITNSVSISDPM